MFKYGDTVQLIKNARYVNGNLVSDTYEGVKLFIKSVTPEGYILSRSLDSAQIGPAVKKNAVVDYDEVYQAEIDPYFALLNVDTEVHFEPTFDSKILKVAPKFSLFKIVNEKNGWGKIEIGAGWIPLKDAIVSGKK